MTRRQIYDLFEKYGFLEEAIKTGSNVGDGEQTPVGRYIALADSTPIKNGIYSTAIAEIQAYLRSLVQTGNSSLTRRALALSSKIELLQEKRIKPNVIGVRQWY